MNQSVDLAVLGGGPAGYVAAIKAAGKGMKTVIIERESLGGTCLNWGCIPAKSLLYSAELLNHMKSSGLFGISVENPKPVFESIIKRSRFCSERLGAGVQFLMKNKNIQILKGRGRILDPHTIEVKKTNEKATETVSAKYILVASGAHPKLIPGIEPDGKIIWTARDALMPSSQPESLVIIGAGAIGIELASFYNTIGTKVSVLEGLERVLPAEDADISEAVRKSFTRRGIEILTGVKVLSVRAEGNQAHVAYSLNGQENVKKASAVLLALGVSPNTKELGLENTKAELNQAGGIITDEWGQTAEPSIFAAGDVTVPPFLAHKASRQGIICVEKMTGAANIKPLSSLPMPACTFCMPQVASIGLSEKKAVEAGVEIAIGRFPLMGNGKSVIMGQTEGFIKTVVDKKTGKVLGVHMVGEGVTELIHSISIGMANGLDWENIASAIFPHPTQSEMIEEAFLNAFGEAVHAQ